MFWGRTFQEMLVATEAAQHTQGLTKEGWRSRDPTKNGTSYRQKPPLQSGEIQQPEIAGHSVRGQSTKDVHGFACGYVGSRMEVPGVGPRPSVLCSCQHLSPATFSDGVPVESQQHLWLSCQQRRDRCLGRPSEDGRVSYLYTLPSIPSRSDMPPNIHRVESGPSTMVWPKR